MGKLKIQYVQRLSHQAEELPEDVVEIYIHFAMGRVDVAIVRQGFIASNRAVQAITDRIIMPLQTGL